MKKHWTARVTVALSLAIAGAAALSIGSPAGAAVDGQRVRGSGVECQDREICLYADPSALMAPIQRWDDGSDWDNLDDANDKLSAIKNNTGKYVALFFDENLGGGLIYCIPPYTERKVFDNWADNQASSLSVGGEGSGVCG